MSKYCFTFLLLILTCSVWGSNALNSDSIVNISKSDTIFLADIFSQPYSNEINSNFFKDRLHSNINGGANYFITTKAENKYSVLNFFKNYGLISYYKKSEENSKKKKIIYLDIFPVKEIIVSSSSRNKNLLYETNAGIVTRGLINNKFSWFLQLQLSDYKLPEYLDSIVNITKVIPGQGFATKHSNGVWSTFYKVGGIKFSPNKYFSFQLGNGKNFFGDGYRSLLLSDNAAPYPYFMITTRIWKFNYVNLFTNLYDIRGNEGIRNRYVNKYSSMHYLSWNVSSRFNISIFEAIVFQNRSQSGRNNFFEPNYLNPIIFYRPVEYSVGSPDNSLLGINLRFNLDKQKYFYGQLILDEFLLKEIKARSGWLENKQGFQLGFKYFDFMSKKNLDFVAEWNYIRPYTYFHKNVLQNFGHYNQPLAHPLGANFSEIIAKLNYKLNNRISLSGTFMYCNIGLDNIDSLSGSLSYGQNIYQPSFKRPNEYGNYVGQGLESKLIIGDLQAYYLLSSNSNIYFSSGVTFRNVTNTLENKNELIFNIGLRTILQRKERFL